jgi:hypothetical protein
MGEASAVTVVEARTMNLLGLIMKGLLEQNLATMTGRRRVASLRGAVLVQAGGMRVVLEVRDGGVTIRLPGDGERFRARVHGAMTALLAVVNGALVGPVLTGRIRVGGDLFFLVRLLPLIRTEA